MLKDCTVRAWVVAMPDGKLFHLANVPLTEIGRGAFSRLVAGEGVLLSFFEIGPGVHFPVHSHPNEQVMVVLEGSATFTIGERGFEVKAGDVCVIPPNAAHGGPAGEKGVKGIDIFVPPREDYLRKAAR